MTIRCEQKDKNFRACPLVPNIHVSALATSPADATSALPMTIYIGGKKMCKAFNVVAGGTEGFRYGDVGTLEVTGSAVTCLSVSSRATFLVVGYEDTLLPGKDSQKLTFLIGTNRAALKKREDPAKESRAVVSILNSYVGESIYNLCRGSNIGNSITCGLYLCTPSYQHRKQANW